MSHVPSFFLTMRNAGPDYNMGYVKGHKKWSANGKIFHATKDLKLCVLHLAERGARGEIFVEYEYLKWKKVLAARNGCLIHQTGPEQESITVSWNQRKWSRNKAQISNSGADLPLEVLASLPLDVTWRWTHFCKTFQPSICGNRAQGECEGLLHEICHGRSGKVTKYSFWSCNFYLKI